MNWVHRACKRQLIVIVCLIVCCGIATRSFSQLKELPSVEVDLNTRSFKAVPPFDKVFSLTGKTAKVYKKVTFDYRIDPGYYKKRYYFPDLPLGEFTKPQNWVNDDPKTNSDPDVTFRFMAGPIHPNVPYDFRFRLFKAVPSDEITKLNTDISNLIITEISEYFEKYPKLLTVSEAHQLAATYQLPAAKDLLNKALGINQFEVATTQPSREGDERRQVSGLKQALKNDGFLPTTIGNDDLKELKVKLQNEVNFLLLKTFRDGIFDLEGNEFRISFEPNDSINLRTIVQKEVLKVINKAYLKKKPIDLTTLAADTDLQEAIQKAFDKYGLYTVERITATTTEFNKQVDALILGNLQDNVSPGRVMTSDPRILQPLYDQYRDQLKGSMATKSVINPKINLIGAFFDRISNTINTEYIAYKRSRNEIDSLTKKLFEKSFMLKFDDQVDDVLDLERQAGGSGIKLHRASVTNYTSNLRICTCTPEQIAKILTSEALTDIISGDRKFLTGSAELDLTIPAGKTDNRSIEILREYLGTIRILKFASGAQVFGDHGETFDILDNILKELNTHQEVIDKSVLARREFIRLKNVLLDPKELITGIPGTSVFTLTTLSSINPPDLGSVSLTLFENPVSVGQSVITVRDLIPKLTYENYKKIISGTAKLEMDVVDQAVPFPDTLSLQRLKNFFISVIKLKKTTGDDAIDFPDSARFLRDLGDYHKAVSFVVRQPGSIKRRSEIIQNFLFRKEELFFRKGNDGKSIHTTLAAIIAKPEDINAIILKEWWNAPLNRELDAGTLMKDYAAALIGILSTQRDEQLLALVEDAITIKGKDIVVTDGTSDKSLSMLIDFVRLINTDAFVDTRNVAFFANQRESLANIHEILLEIKKRKQPIIKYRTHLSQLKTEFPAVIRGAFNISEFQFSDISSLDIVSEKTPYISLDVGVLYVPAINGLASYSGANIYFKPVDKQAPLSNFKGIDRWLMKRLCVLVGTTTGFAKFENKRVESLITGSANNNFNILTGAGYRLNNVFKVNAGAFWYKVKSENPLIESRSIGGSFFFSLSADVDVVKALGAFGNLISGKP
ncbi:MAG TPA: hypothetical protein VK508_15280 [Cyclobacteriaceae bacterium]|nr:hypothetical protein [Cyclobacteriaceae bacterium]